MEEASQVSLKRFNCRDATKKTFNAVVVGKKHTGKSTVVQDLLYYLYKDNIPRVCVFSATEPSNHFYSQYVPETFVFGDENVEDRLKNIMDSQKKLRMKKDLGQIPTGTDIRIAIVLDDIGYKKGALSGETVREIFMNGRHHDVVVIVAVQFLNHIRPDLRSNADYVFCLKESNAKNIKNLHENYFCCFDKVKHFQTAFNACTSDYQCMVLNNTIPSTQASDVCSWYKAKHGREFKMGSKEYWNYHNERFISDMDKYILESYGDEDTADITVTKDGKFSIKKEK